LHRLGLGYLFKQEVTLSNPLRIGIPKDWVRWLGLLKNNQAQQLFIAALDE
jgi:hypothetical protein